MKRLRAAGWGVCFAASVGFGVAGLDLLLRRWGGLATGSSALLGASVLYTAPLALVAAAWAFWRASSARVLAISIPLALAIVCGGLVNILWLPSQRSAPSLLFDLALAGICGLLVVLLCRLPPAGRRARILSLAVLALACAHAMFQARVRSATPRDVGSVAAADAPDLIVVLLDALRADHTSVYGYARETTPRLHALAAESVGFDRAYAPSSWTKPAVATLFTGVLPATHGNHRISSSLPRELPTLPELLSTVGYRSGVFAENSFVSELFGFGRGTDRIVSNEADVAAQTTLGHVLLQLATRYRRFEPVYALALLCNRFDPRHDFKSRGDLDVIGSSLNWVRAQPPAQRIFLYVHLMKPHAPYSCPPPYDGSFAPADGDSPVALRPPHVEGLGAFARATQPQAELAQHLVANYDERTLYGDSLLGQLLDGLNACERLENALIVVLSDHGEELGEHGLWDHGHSLQEGVIQVPLLLRLPDREFAGRRVASVVRLVDVPATLLGAAGLVAPAHVAGLDLRPMLVDPTLAVDRAVVLQLRHAPGYEMQGYLRGRQKLVHTRDGGRELWQLFDLASDPSESVDRFADLRATADSLRRDLELALTAAAVHGHADADVELDPHTLERLRALGYVE